MKVKKALLNTEFVTEEWIRERDKNWNFTQEDIDRILKAEKLLNGQIAILNVEMCKFYGGDYSFYGLENEEIFKEWVWLMEQDTVFGTYIDDRERFDEDWDNGEYEPEGVFTIPKEYIKEWID